MNTSLLRMRKAIASFTIGTLLASFLAVPAAFAAGTPEWAMEGANAYLKAETRDQGYVLANKCEVATMIANALDLPMGDTEAQRGAEFQDLQGGMAWCQAAAGAVANTGIATGNGDMFGAAGSVSRAVVATMLVRAFQLDAAYQPAALSAERQAEFAGLEWAQEPMALGVAAGIINGDAEGRLLPMEGASKWAVATMLYRAANMGAEEATEEATEETTEEAPATPEVAPTGGALTVSLSDNSPSLANLGSSTAGVIDGVEIAVFELSAGSDDVRVSSLRLHEIGGNEVFGPIALFDADGMRISREKSFNNDNEANVSLLNGGLTIPAGKSVELFVRASVAANKGAATAALAIESPDDISSNASSVSVSGATTELARMVQVAVDTFEVKAGGSTPDVSVGDRNVQVARFDMVAGNEDMHLHALTLEQTGSINAESEMSNFRLEIEGEEVASAAYSVDDYISFVLDTPYEVEEDDTVSARVFADILDGAGDNIIFGIESDLDVVAIDQAVQQPARIVDTTSSAFTTTTVNVEAGELTLVAHDASFTEFGKNQSNLVLGYVDIESRSGEQIELQDINLKLNANGDTFNVGGNQVVLDLTTIEAVTSNGTFDLSASASTDKDGGNADADCDDNTDSICTFSASNVDLMIDGVQRVWFRADSVDDNFTEDITITASLESMTGGGNTDGLYFKEVNDDTAITDITPTNITFEDITSKVSSATVRSKAQSASLTAVQGTDNVIAMAFEIEASEASYLDVDNLTIQGFYDAAGGAVDAADEGANTYLSSDHVDSLRLYHTSANDEANLIDEQGGGELASGLVEFDLGDYRIEASETTSFFVVVDLADNDDVNNDSIRVSVATATIRDMENDTVTLKDADGNTMTGADFDTTTDELSRRTIVFASAGTFTSTIDNTDSRSDRNMYVLAGETAIVGSIEVAAENEELRLKDFSIAFDGDQNGSKAEFRLSDQEATEMLSSVQLLDEDLNELASATVSGRIVNFDNKDIVIPVGTQNLYVQVATNPIGKDLAGIQSPANDLTFRASFNEVRGQKLLSSYLLLAGETATFLVTDDNQALTITVNGVEESVADQANATLGAAALVADINANNDGNDIDDEITGVEVAGEDYFQITAVENVTTITVSSNITTRYSAANSALRAEAATAGTTNSNQFGILPVHITDARLNAEAVSSSLSSNTLLAQLELDNAAHSNTFAANTNELRTKLETLKFNVTKFADTITKDFEISRLGSSAARVRGYNMINDNGGNATQDITCIADKSCAVYIDGVEFYEAFDTNKQTTAGNLENAITAVYAGGQAIDNGDGTITLDFANTNQMLLLPGAHTSITNSANDVNGDPILNLSYVYFNTTNFTTDANYIDNGLTATYRVFGDVEVDGSADTSDFVRLSMDDTSSSAVTYAGEEGTSVTDLRIVATELLNTEVK